MRTRSSAASRLVIEVLRLTSVNPKAYAGLSQTGRNALLYDNLHKTEWT